ncbi:hypothetical protein SISNIDRAFT_482851 [Sistotremastrum niveocremeum HHB9708]|uniref:G-protein coupled receptors family 1 profile domain-containing protein n=1 Tax=Sistotremastrum niveocremeum HHB9708 TaxID=1314777 RepID=A0A164XT40_9AGAM|nr:hypothetical protein SISNIDRAFT_482851 [Sistotremastrum niveocremeum HHB9708]
MSDLGGTGVSHEQLIFNWLYIIIQILGGQIGLPLLLLTFIFSRSVRRDIVVGNFCLTWIISSVSFSLVMYSTLLGERAVSSGLCLLQSVLIEACQAMLVYFSMNPLATAVSTFSLAFNLWMVMQRPRLTAQLKWQMLLCLPSYIVFFTIVVIAFLRGTDPSVDGPNSAVPAAFYCIIVEDGGVSNDPNVIFRTLVSIYIFSAILLGSTFIFEALVLYSIVIRKRHWQPIFQGTFIRVGLFVLYRLVPFVMEPFVIKNPDSILSQGPGRSAPSTVYARAYEIIQAAVPLVAFCVLASAPDVLSAWGLWRRERDNEEVSATPLPSSDTTVFSPGIQYNLQ